MLRFIAKFNKEILTVCMFGAVVLTAICLPELSAVRKILYAYMFWFTLHEWEEGKYPGGFVQLIGGLIGIKVTPELADRGRLPVLALLFSFLYIPFIFDGITWLALAPVYLALFEGFVHIMGIRLFRMRRPYTPGLVTALGMAVTSLGVLYYYGSRELTAWWGYLLAAVLMVLGFMFMQSRLFAMVGMRYRDFPKMLKARILDR